MSAYKHTIVVSGGVSITDQTVGISGTPPVQMSTIADGLKVAMVNVPAATTDQPVAIAFDKDNIKSVLITTTKDVTLKTNSPSSPANTHLVKANGPVIWTEDMSAANPFAAADVTALFLTNASPTDEAVVYITILEDV